MGETEESVYVIGSPELDTHSAPSGVTIAGVRKRYEIPFVDYGIAVFHPVTSEVDDMGRQALDLFSALVDSGRNFVVIRPNNDPGGAAIVNTILTLPVDRFRVLPSMRFAHFSELMRNAEAIVGNSSAGVREAPFLGIPSLDIGTRQTNRALSSSVFQAEAADREKILAFLRDDWGKQFSASPEFGVGHAADNFLSILSDPGFWARPLQKNFNDPDGGQT